MAQLSQEIDIYCNTPIKELMKCTKIYDDVMKSIPSVQQTRGNVEPFDPIKIKSNLRKETTLSDENIALITTEVIKRVIGRKTLSGHLIREICCSVMSELGLEQARKMYTRVGMPVFDYEALLHSGIDENANQIINPESIHHWSADRLSAEYSLLRVLNKKMAMSHLKGDIYIHMLRYFDMRPFCQEWDARMILEYGFPPVGWPHSAKSKPAKSGVVAALHLAKWLGFITQEFSGGMGFDNFTTMLAPYMRGLAPKDIYQVAQAFIFECSQIYASRGAQVPFTSITCTPGISNTMKDLAAIGPQGKIYGVYGDYAEENLALFNAFTEVYTNGDANGHLFNFPKHEVKLRADWMNEYEDAYKKVMKEVSTQGTPYFLNMAADWMPDECHSQCCRIILTPEGMKKVCKDLDAFDWNKSYMNMGSLQSVSLNLPRYAYESKKDKARLFEIIRERMHLSAEILLLKKKLIDKRMEDNVLGICASKLSPYGNKNPVPLLDMRKQSLSIGYTGLNECVHHMTGFELHEDRSAFEFGLEILKMISQQVDIFSADYHVKFSLWEQPAESSAQKLALLDMKHYPTYAKQYVKGTLGTKEIYYTNSGHLNYEADVPMHKRVAWQGEEHPIVQGGVITHLWLGEQHPHPDALWNITKKIALQTKTGYFAYTLDHTQCLACHQTSPGIHKMCPKCHAPEDLLEYWSRITGYYSRVKRYNPAKLEEWKRRNRYELREYW